MSRYSTEEREKDERLLRWGCFSKEKVAYDVLQVTSPDELKLGRHIVFERKKLRNQIRIRKVGVLEVLSADKKREKFVASTFIGEDVGSYIELDFEYEMADFGICPYRDNGYWNARSFLVPIGM